MAARCPGAGAAEAAACKTSKAASRQPPASGAQTPGTVVQKGALCTSEPRKQQAVCPPYFQLALTAVINLDG